MNTTSRIRDTSGPPAGAGAARDFVAVDDSGEFSYHQSEQNLMAAFEYVGEAACILDRSGKAYRLGLDTNRHLMLGPARGAVEFHWLRQAWLDAQNAHPEVHRLRRFFPLPRKKWCRTCSKPSHWSTGQSRPRVHGRWRSTGLHRTQPTWRTSTAGFYTRTVWSTSV